MLRISIPTTVQSIAIRKKQLIMQISFMIVLWEEQLLKVIRGGGGMTMEEREGVCKDKKL